MEQPADFLPAERRTLELGPLWMLSAVRRPATATSTRPTLDALDGLPAAHSAGPSARSGVRRGGRRARAGSRDVLAAFERDGRPVVSGLLQLDDVLSRRPDAEARRASAALLVRHGRDGHRPAPVATFGRRGHAARMRRGSSSPPRSLVAPTPLFGRASA